MRPDRVVWSKAFGGIVRQASFRMLVLCALAGGVVGAPTAGIEPVRVCEVLKDLPAWRGKTAAIVGRYSFRTNGRFLSEDGCESKLTSGSFVWPCALQLTT